MIKNLQVLRAIAALLVAYYHFGFDGGKAGFFGVDIFFVISGFIMSYVLYKSHDHFFIKRVIRIVPMYYLVTMLITLLWMVRPALFRNVYVDVPAFLKSLLFIPYTKLESGPILSSGWTLNYEMYFYVALSFLLLFIKSTKTLLYTTTAVLLGICALQASGLIRNYYLSFYGNPVVIEFILGIGLYWGYEHYKDKANSQAVLLLGLVSIVAFCLMFYCDLNHITTYRLFLFGIPSFFVTAFFVFSEKSWRKDGWLYKWLFRLGNASYVIYLIHPFVMNVFQRLLKPLLSIDNRAVELAELLLAMFFICLVGDWVHQKIEKPLLKKIEQQLIH